MSFHVFQATTYITAFFFGTIISHFPKAAFSTMVVLYILGGGALAFALIVMPPMKQFVPYIPVALAAFGLCVGTFKSTIPKVIIPSKSPYVFVGCMFTEMILEVCLLGLVSMFTFGYEILIALTLYGLSSLVILIGTIEPFNDPRHLTEKTFRFMNVMRCMFHGLWRLLAYHAQQMTSKKPKPDELEKKHWMYRSEKKFGKGLVEALIIKITLHKFYPWIAGVWIGVEIKNSYWIFSSYLTDRTLGPLLIHPAQYLAIPSLLNVIGIPLFVLVLAPALTRSFYNTGVRQMSVGAFFILFATGISWQLSARQAEVSTNFMERDFKHTQVRIINGHTCPSGISSYFPMDPDLARVIHPKPAIQTAFAVQGPRGGPQIGIKRNIETVVNVLTPLDQDTYLKYVMMPPLSREVVGTLEQETREPTDSFSYMVTIGRSFDKAVTVTAYTRCDTLNTITLDIPMDLRRKRNGHSDVFLVHQGNNSAYRYFGDLNYGRDVALNPGVRVYLVAKKENVKVELLRDSTVLATIDSKQGVSDLIWLRPGDGPNLEIRALGEVVKITYKLGVAEIADLLVITTNTTTVKVLSVQPPFQQSKFAPIFQYSISALGELLLGVIGLQYLIRHAPHKMQYFVFLDWYLMLGFSNIAIVVVSQLPWLLVFHGQLSYLTLIVGTSFCFLLAMATRF